VNKKKQSFWLKGKNEKYNNQNKKGRISDQTKKGQWHFCEEKLKKLNPTWWRR